MSSGEVSGVDLARVALRAALEQARKSGGQNAKKKRPVRSARRDGREPMGLGTAIGVLVTERAWDLPAAGATLRERWAAVAPELAGHVAAIGYDADTGRLTVCPESSAWATKTRLEQARVIEAANESAGRTVVRALKILAPGTVPVPEPADADPAPAAPAGPVHTRETASPGYRRALAAHQEVAPPRRVNLAIADTVERQNAAMRALSARAFPETAVPDEQPAPIEAALARRRRQAAATEAAALRRARAERAGRHRARASLDRPHDLTTRFDRVSSACHDGAS
ncbi:DciA family protein [Streptomyces diastatochromogenes]|uniref:DciA family protein n=1 Tax=Streptomyces diastatochromogenes TaxID=42236 RepID=UPI002F262D89